MTTPIMRPLTPVEIDTIRVALCLLLYTDGASLDLLHARASTEVNTIASDGLIAVLMEELDGAEVGVRRAGA